jgi:hypothetical protein
MEHCHRPSKPIFSFSAFEGLGVLMFQKKISVTTILHSFSDYHVDYQKKKKQSETGYLTVRV